MKNILEEVVEKRKATVQQLKSIVPIQAWEMMPLYKRKCLSLQKSLLNENGTGIIAERLLFFFQQLPVKYFSLVCLFFVALCVSTCRS
ncbi:hypothetical protein [Ferruginibacter sp.]